MSRRSKLAVGIVAAATVAVAVGASGAVAVSRVLDRDGSNAIIEDAARQLGVEPEALSDALEQALENRVDEALESGLLTEEQAERLKARIGSAASPLFGGLGFHPPGHGFGRGLGRSRGFASLEVASSYLGLTEAELRDRLRDGSSLAEIARDEEKSVAGLVDALVDEAKARIDQAVEAGKLTNERAAELEEGLEERTTRLVNGELRSRGHGKMLGRGSGFPGGPPPFAGPRG